MKIYCSACGHPNAYTAKKPKFCNECGKSFGVAKAEVIPSPASPEANQEETVENVPQLRGLDVEIEASKVRGITLGEIVDSGVEGVIDEVEGSAKKPRRKKRTKRAREQFLQDWQSEAGAIRRKQK